jgi:hypothetical protein
MKNSFYIILFVLIASTHIKAQSVQWALKPKYTSLQYYTEGLYKIHLNGKVGLLSKAGDEFLEALYDSITPFNNGYALAINRERGKYAIKKIINNNNSLTTVTGNYYLTKYPYFSEDLLCVTNANKNYGYLSKTGQLAIECKYLDAHPFFNGRASITLKSKNVVYIKEDGSYMSMDPGQGYIVFGSSFCNEEAVVYTIDRKGYVINTEGHSLHSFNQSIESLQVNTSDYRIEGSSCKVSSENNDSYNKTQSDGIIPFQENGLYGYKNGNVTILPEQFTAASPFQGGYAKVTKEGKIGILKLVTGSFSGSLLNDNIKVEKGKSEMIKYKVTCPPIWKDNSLTLHIDNNNGQSEELQPTVNIDGCLYKISPQIKDHEEKITYNLSLQQDGLVLWEGKQDVHLIYIIVPPPIPIVHEAIFETSRPMVESGKVKDKKTGKLCYRADANDKCHVCAEVRNISHGSGEITVSIYANNNKLSTESFYIPGGGSRTIKANLIIKTKKSVTISVCTNKCGEKNATYGFIPFY